MLVSRSRSGGDPPPQRPAELTAKKKKVPRPAQACPAGAMSIAERKPNKMKHNPSAIHPAWCDPRRCHETDTDRQHCSGLILLRLRDAQITCAWVQADEHAFPAEPGTPELRIDIAHGIQGHDSTLYLSPQEIHRLKDLLTAEYYRAQYVSAPVVHNTKTVA